jgi:hypothetical protein
MDERAKRFTDHRGRSLHPEPSGRMDCRAGLDDYSDRQKQQDAQQRGIWFAVVALRLVVHNRTKIRSVSFVPAGCEPIVASDMKAAA